MTNNPYLQPAIDAAQGDIVRNYNLATQPAFNSAMVRSGSFGNSGVQQLNENAQLNLQKSLGDVSSNMRNNDYQFDQQFNRSLYNDAYGQQQQNLQTSVGLLNQLQGYNTQDAQNATGIQNTPLNYWQQFSQSANALGGAGGGSTGNTLQAGGGSNPWVSALGGAQLGSSIAKGWGGGSNSMGNSVNTGGSGGWNNTPQQNYFYGNGGSGG